VIADDAMGADTLAYRLVLLEMNGAAQLLADPP